MTVQPGQNGKILRFGMFELDPASASLRKSGTLVRLQEQPARVLLQLLEKRGAVVTREELQRTLWTGDTFVDFDGGLNTAVNKIRDALGDSASSPRFVETVPRKGYRFIAPVEEVLPAPAVRKPLPKWIWAALGLSVAATAAVVWLAREAPLTAREPVVTPLTTLPGGEFLPSLSPDGDRVAFSYSDAPGKMGSRDIYIKQIGSEQVLQITTDPAMDTGPAWSPDGREIAFARWFPDGRYSLYVTPSMGGPERKIGEFHGPEEPLFRAASWGPDGKWMVITDRTGPEPQSLYSLVVATGEKRRLTTGSGRGDIEAAVSPDGKSVAFVRRTRSQSGELYLQRLSGEYAPLGEPVRLVSGPQNPRSPAWTGDGQIVFQFGWAHLPVLARISPRGGAAVRIGYAGEFAGFPTASLRGNRLCFMRLKSDVNIWTLTLGGAGGTTKDLWRGSSSYLDHVPQFSPDGRRVAFISNRNGPQSVWAAHADGSRAARLTDFTDREVLNADWSHDGKTLFFNARGSRYALPSDGGAPRELIVPGLSGYSEGIHSSSDGKWWYLASDKTGRSEIWKTPAGGGAAIQVTRNGGRRPQSSADGRYVYYSGIDPDKGLWRVASDGGTEEKALESLIAPANYQVTEDGIYYMPGAGPEARTIRLLRFATGKTETLATLDKPWAWGLSVSPDRRTILYAQVDHSSFDLELVESFR